MCNDNIFQGIWVGSESSPTLLRNLCEGNKDSGIVYFDKAGGVAKNNVCRGNLLGICVGGQAQPTLEENTCEGNKLRGIAFLGKSGGVARKNVCRNNGDDKIYVASTANPNIED